MNINAPIRIKEKFNKDWQFALGDMSDFEYGQLNDSTWENVCLPHTPKIEEADVCRPFQGICSYRKHFWVDKVYRGKKIFIEFEAAMQEAGVWVNGKHKIKHLGGYLPFIIDITDDVRYDEENIIAVRLDNRDNGDIPPGKQTEYLDFCYFGGLYRNVFFHITDKLHVTDAVYEGQTASGGIFITYPGVSEQKAQVMVKVHVRNEYVKAMDVKAEIAIEDKNGNIIKTAETTYEVMNSMSCHTFSAAIDIDNPHLWHPDFPYLYTVSVRIISGQTQTDEIKTRIGIRSISFSKQEGFRINGEKMKIRGANRHQIYPYLGNAASDGAQYRDARKLKDAGFNFLRLAHYPQSPAFLDACDELGIMVAEPVPGWQWCREGTFQEITLQNVRDMVRRDRNHPCIILWEVSLNETDSSQPGASDGFYRRLHETAHEEYPGSQMFTGGDTTGRKNPSLAGFDVPYSEWNDEDMSRSLDSLPNKAGLDREYGDWEFGGNDSTSRQTREDGEEAMLLQAWNFQWSHNKNLTSQWSVGDAIWVGIDYNRGYWPSKPVCTCGCLDLFRLPKFVYYFYQSQRKPEILREDIDSGPMVYIANYWTERASPAKVVVFSNCDEVELYVNNCPVGRKRPDNGPDTPYTLPSSKADPAYWLKNTDRPLYEADQDVVKSEGGTGTMFDGSNCRNLHHAPFTFEGISFETGELRAVGLINGKCTAQCIRKTPGEAAMLTLRFDTCGRELAADGADFIFIHAEVTDSEGTVIPHDSRKIEFSTEGPGDLTGSNPVCAEAGIASIILRAGNIAGEITVRAEAEGVSPAVAVMRSVK